VDLGEVGWGDVDWIDLAQDRDRWRALVNSVLNLRFVGKKPRGKGPPGRPKRRWLDNIRMDLVEVEWGDVYWIGLAQDRDSWRALVNSVLNLRFVGRKARGKGPPGRPKRRWLDNIRMDLVEVGWGDVDWIGLAQDRDRSRALED
jgi:hypothetical protein